MLQIHWVGTPVSKSNQYVIINRKFKSPKTGRWEKRPSLARSKATVRVEQELAKLFERALDHSVIWEVPKGKKKPVPVNPLYPKGQLVRVDVLFVTAKERNVADADGITKVIGDAGNTAGVWFDDTQAVKWDIERIVVDGAKDQLIVRVSPWASSLLEETRRILHSPSPLRRREWIAQKAAEEAIPKLESVICLFCDHCGIAVGKHCYEEEVWLYPKQRRGGVDFAVVCGSCADDKELDFQYRIITADEIRTLRRFETGLRVEEKKKELRRVYREQARRS